MYVRHRLTPAEREAARHRRNVNAGLYCTLLLIAVLLAYVAAP